MRFYVQFYKYLYLPDWNQIVVPQEAFIYRNDPMNVHHWDPEWAKENVFPLLKLDDEVRYPDAERYRGWNGRPDTDSEYHRLFIGTHVGGLYGDSEKFRPLLLHCDSMAVPIATSLIKNYGCVYFDDVHNPQPIPNLKYIKEHSLYLDMHIN